MQELVYIELLSRWSLSNTEFIINLGGTYLKAIQ